MHRSAFLVGVVGALLPARECVVSVALGCPVVPGVVAGLGCEDTVPYSHREGRERSMIRQTFLRSKNVLGRLGRLRWATDVNGFALFVLLDEIRKPQEIHSLRAKDGHVKGEEQGAHQERQNKRQQNLIHRLATGVHPSQQKGGHEETDKDIGHRATTGPFLAHLLHRGLEMTCGQAQVGGHRRDRKDTVGGIGLVGKDTLVLVPRGLVSRTTRYRRTGPGGTHRLCDEPRQETMGEDHFHQKETEDAKRQVMGQEIQEEGTEEDGIRDKRMNLYHGGKNRSDDGHLYLFPI